MFLSFLWSKVLALEFRELIKKRNQQWKTAKQEKAFIAALKII